MEKYRVEKTDSGRFCRTANAIKTLKLSRPWRRVPSSMRPRHFTNQATLLLPVCQRASGLSNTSSKDEIASAAADEHPRLDQMLRASRAPLTRSRSCLSVASP